MTYRDKLLALRKQEPLATPSVEHPREGQPAPVKRESRFPERHCSKCGEVGDSETDLIKSDGYLWHRACLQEPGRGARSVICWHCHKPCYRPQYLSWGRDLIPLHKECAGPWIGAWDTLFAQRGGGGEQ
jgi:hypothetical protein